MIKNHYPRWRDAFRRRGPVFAAALLASSALTGVAFAQTAEEEIIVTATKRSENIQDIPLSVQALGERLLDEQQVQSFDDYAALLPSVSFQSFGPGQAQVAFRGVSSGGDGLHIGPRPTAATYLDDASVTTVANTVDLRIYDVARVEALSGPQGTLFGASALSGVVRVITNQPDASGFEAGYDIEGNYFTEGEMGGSLEGFVNIPISNNVALRLVGYFDRDGGYIDNIPSTRTYTLSDADPLTNVTIDNAALAEDDVNDVETYGGRAALRIDLNEDWVSTTTVLGQHQQTEGPFLFDPDAGDLAVRDFLPTSNEDEWWMAAQTIQGRIGNFDLVYSASYFDRRVDNESDYSYYTVAYDTVPDYTLLPDGAGGFLDPTQSVVLGDDYTMQSHELRVTSPAENRLRFTAGLFYQTQDNNIEADYIIRGISGIPTPPLTVPVIGFGDSVFRTRITREDEDFAVFGEASFDLTEQLTLTAGGRSFNTENSILGFSGFQFNAENPNCLPTSATDRPCDNVNKTFEEDGSTYRVSAAYDFDEDRMVYGTISTGYRPGGNNRRPGILAYDSDTLTNYEIGWKTQWLDRAIRFNGSVFVQEWEDLQFGLSPLGSLGVTNTYNAGSAEIQGLELDASWIVDSNWTLSGSATFINAELTSDFCSFDALGNSVCTPGDPPAAPAGTRLPIQPEFKGTLTARYEFTLGGSEAFAQGTLFHQGGTRSFLTDADFAAVGPTKGFTTFDVSAGMEFAGHSWELYVNNLFDERGILSRNTACATSFCGVFARSYPTQPRLVGLRASRRF